MNAHYSKAYSQYGAEIVAVPQSLRSTRAFKFACRSEGI